MKGRGLLIFAGFLMVLFFVVARFLPPKILLEAARTLHISVVLAVVLSFSGVALRALRKPAMGAGDIMAVGILGTFVAEFGYGVWTLAWRLSGQPAWMTNHDITAFWIALATTAGMFYLAAPGAIDGHVPPKNRVVIGASVGCGFLLLAAIVSLSVDFSSWAAALKPWLWDGTDTGYTNAMI